MGDVPVNYGPADLPPASDPQVLKSWQKTRNVSSGGSFGASTLQQDHRRKILAKNAEKSPRLDGYLGQRMAPNSLLYHPDYGVNIDFNI
jgi:hypothetical protein